MGKYFSLFSLHKWVLIACICIIIGCQSTKPTLSYQDYSHKTQKHIDQICSRLTATHFIVREKKIIVKKKASGELIKLKHYESHLPDGYYYCKQRSLPESHLE